MNITFSILDSEADLIAKQHGYDSKTDKEEFVLECFKQFGRDCITSQALQAATMGAENSKKASVESAKSEISF